MLFSAFFSPFRRLCSFVFMEAYLSEIGCDDHLWKPFAYARLIFSLSDRRFLRKKNTFELNHKNLAMQRVSK